MSIYDLALTFFRENDFPVVEVNPGQVLQTLFNGDSQQFNGYLQVPAGQSQAIFYSLYPTHASGDLAAINEFLTRANYGLVIGNFELDFDDGSIRYKTSLDGTGRDVTVRDIRNMVEANLYTMNRYATGINAVLDGDEVGAAILAIESSTSS